MEVMNRIEFAYDNLDEAFPPVDPLVAPCGDNVLVQIRSPKTKTKSGIHIVTDMRDTEFWVTQVAIVRAVGPVAYRFHDTLEPWPEGPWCEVGDYVRVPKHGGDRWTVKVPIADKEKTSVFDIDANYEAMMVIFRAKEIIGKITGDPTLIKAFL